MKLLITGATGYIGKRLVQAAKSHGHQVVVATKVDLDLLSPREFVMPSGIDTVFHLAAITDAKLSNPANEIKAASYLFTAAAQKGAKLVFVSSQAARSDAPTDYGRTKWQIEQLAIGANGCVVRPGQVYGGFESGLFGVLSTVVRKLPCYPAFLPAPKIQPIHVDDLVSALLSCATTPGLESSILNVGAERPISFTSFLNAIAHYWVKRTRLPFPVPVVFIHIAISVLGTNLSKKMGLERLTSLFDLKTMETTEDLKRLGISLRSLHSGMSRSGDSRRRNLASEGRALLHYVLGTQPDQALIRRYVRSIELLRDGLPLGISALMLKHPVLIALLDEPGRFTSERAAEFTWRLNAAMVFAEASTAGGTRFLGLGNRAGFVVNAFAISRTLAMEIVWRVVRLISKPIYTPRVLRDKEIR